MNRRPTSRFCARHPGEHLTEMMDDSGKVWKCAICLADENARREADYAAVGRAITVEKSGSF